MKEQAPLNLPCQKKGYLAGLQEAYDEAQANCGML
jgi:hypothetical protein